MKLLAITDVEQASEGTHLAAYRSLAARVPLGIQLRDRRPAREVIAFGRRLLELGVPVIVNDRVDVALVLGIDRVHLGRTSVSVTDVRRLLGAGSWISGAVHPGAPGPWLSEVEGADAWLVSPIFRSPGKPDPVGIETLSRLRAEHPRRTLFALGGVDASSARRCLEAGADGVAVIRAALDVAAHDALADALR